jgi:hypothetical protein
MQGLVLQLTRGAFLLLLWLFIWSVLRILRTDIYAPSGAVMVRRGLPMRGGRSPARTGPVDGPRPRPDNSRPPAVPLESGSARRPASW